MLGGFTLSGATGENENVDNGIVAYLIPEGTTVDWTDSDKVLEAQKTYDQFVWVPVEDAIAVDMDSDDDIDTIDIDLMISAERFPMAIPNGTNNDGTTKYRGVLYEFSLSSDGTKVEIADMSYTADSGNREPAYLNDSTNADASSNNNVSITALTLQSEFDSMITKVKDNGGFWVGRYETTNMTTDNTTDRTNKVTVIKGTSTGISNLMWYRMYAQQKSYSKLALGQSTTRTSSMIWGSQWDQIMIWMRKIENSNSFYILSSLSMGNFGTSDDTDTNTSTPTNTGNSENYNVKNIYDTAGNAVEWVLEANDTSNRVGRRRILLDYRYIDG